MASAGEAEEGTAEGGGVSPSVIINVGCSSQSNLLAIFFITSDIYFNQNNS